MMTSRPPSRALNLVNTFARTMSDRGRLVVDSVRLTCPRARRSATSAVERPEYWVTSSIATGVMADAGQAALSTAVSAAATELARGVFVAIGSASGQGANSPA